MPTGEPSELTVKALQYLRDRPGEEVHYRDVAEAIGAPSANDLSSVFARSARLHPQRGIHAVGDRSGKYVYRPDHDGSMERRAPDDGPKPGDLFEVVGKIQAGTVVVRDPVTFELFRLKRW